MSSVLYLTTLSTTGPKEIVFKFGWGNWFKGLNNDEDENEDEDEDEDEDEE